VNARQFTEWWFRPAPLARVAVLRALIYLYVPLDLFVRTAQVTTHAYGTPELYRPIALLRVLHQPSPTPWLVQTLRAVIFVSALVAATGRLRRGAGWLLAFAYFDWVCLAMSYRKVDHDHLALLVAVFVLPTVAEATWRSERGSESAAWALRCIQVGAVATYFLAAWAKVRFGGLHWATGAIFTAAILGQGTRLARPLLHHPDVLVAAQWGLLAAEVASPLLLFVRQRRQMFGVAVLLVFHLLTWLTIGVNFVALVVCLAAFLPLEAIAHKLPNTTSVSAPVPRRSRVRPG
jgi:hypothetical protein